MTASRHRFIRLLGAALIALAVLAVGAAAIVPTGVTTAETTVPTITGTVNVTVPTVNTTSPTGNATVPPVVVPNQTAVPTLTVAPNVTTGNATVAPTVTPPVTGGAADVVLTPGATVFLGENGLDITATGVAAGSTLGWFQAGSDVMTSSPDDTLIVSDPTSFYVQPGIRTGAWYDLNRNRAIVFNVRDPSLNIRVWDVLSNQDVTDRTITRGRLLTFRIDSNLDAVAAQRGIGAPVTVRVQGPAGNVYSALIDDLGNQNPITDVPVTSSSFLVPGQGSNGTVWDTANAAYQTGDFRVWAETNLNGMKDNYKDPSGADYTGRTITSQYTVTLGRDDLVIESNVNESVVRNNDFAVIINGQASTDYALWIAGTSSLTGDETAPKIKVGQSGVTLGDPAVGQFAFSTGRTVAEDVPAVANETTNPYYARVSTDANGRRTVGFSTDQQTRDQSYTIRVQTLDPSMESRSDTVDIEIVTGGVAFDAIESASVYLGEEIVISGTNTDSSTTYLFVTGPNIPGGGARLTDMAAVVTGDAGSFTSASVAADDTWEYRWNTANLNIDAGSYTIYAVSSPNNRDNLGGTEYATASVITRRPFVTANASTATVAKGDIFAITGSAEGNPTSGVAIWLFGTNYYSRTTQSVNDDNTFRYELSRGATQNLATGQYFAVVQHPMTNGVFDVDEVVEGDVTRVYDTSGNFFVAAGPGRLQGSDAATALVDLINGPNIDDTYTVMTFAVVEASITLNVADVRPGDQLRVEGTTNLAPGNDLLVSITSSAFEPTDKSQQGGFSGLSGQTKVQAGEGGLNTFNFTADTTSLPPDLYQVVVESPTAGASQTATFSVTDEAGGNVTPGVTATVDGNATVTVGTTGTAAPGETTAAPTATGNATATPTATPGFGTLVALAGLAGVAILVVRRRD